MHADVLKRKIGVSPLFLTTMHLSIYTAKQLYSFLKQINYCKITVQLQAKINNNCSVKCKCKSR